MAPSVLMVLDLLQEFRLAAEPISVLCADGQVIWALRLLCLTFLVSSIGMVPYNLLTKAFNLQGRAIAEAMGAAASALAAPLSTTI
jgi:hypothetical protein